MEKVLCSVCGQETDEAREVSFMHWKFQLCPEDFQLAWQGFSSVAMLCRQLRAVGTSSQRTALWKR